jgi:hypothetical protein
VVTQGVSPDVTTTLGFNAGGNVFRDSEEAIKVDGTANSAGNRLIIYTDNSSATASPQFAPTATGGPDDGIDGGGLVGVTDRSLTVPLLWVVQDANSGHTFTTATVGDDEIFVTDRAHVRSFTPRLLGGAEDPAFSALDTAGMAFCVVGGQPAGTLSPSPNPDDGIYPQYFGSPNVGTTVFNHDLCATATVVINGVTYTAGQKIPQAEELSKNIAVAAFGFLGTVGSAPNLTTPSPTDTIAVTLPIYLPIGGDFRFAPAQDYSTNTLAIELVTQ